jgi:Asp-tRNA(Asn)/Glu-tRNA(Gln) amidotransferase A subunit family amidase
MCRSVEDCAIVFEAIRGPDNRDLAVVDMPFNWDGNRLRIGFLEDAFGEDAHPNDLATFKTMLNLGADLQPVRLPEHADMDALQMLLVDEAAAFDELIQTGKVDMLIQDREHADDAGTGESTARYRRLHCTAPW